MLTCVQLKYSFVGRWTTSISSTREESVIMYFNILFNLGSHHFILVLRLTQKSNLDETIDYMFGITYNKIKIEIFVSF